MKTRSKSSSLLNFANDSAAGPIRMITLGSTPDAFRFSRAIFTIVDDMEITVPVKIDAYPLHNVGIQIVQG